MTPKEKAEELFGKYAIYLRANLRYDEEANEDAKVCALIAVDEILKRTRSVDTMPPNCQKIDENTKEYWQKVKKEIEKL
jgi:hypothetical protein